MECVGDECASPSPYDDPYSVLPDPDEWPEPPEWMFTAVYVIIAIMAVAVVIVIVAALLTWRRRTGEVRARQPKEWVDLADLPETTRGGVQGVRSSVADDDASANSTDPPDSGSEGGGDSGDNGRGDTGGDSDK